MPRHPLARPRRARGSTLASLVVVLGLVAVGLAGCSGDDEPGAAPPAATPTTSVAPEVTTVARWGTVTGRLSPAAKQRLRARLVPAVDRWIDAAYLGDYPREEFGGAFRSFTSGAERRAKKDVALMSNAELGGRLEAVTALKRQVRFDVLAVRGHAVGVTAHVVVSLRLAGEGLDRRDRVAGRLLLTYAESAPKPGWRVFGYDMTRSEV